MTIKYKGVFVREKYFHKTVTIFVCLIVNVGMLTANQIFAGGDIEAGKLNHKFVPLVMDQMVIASTLNGLVWLANMRNTLLLPWRLIPMALEIIPLCIHWQ